MRAGLWEKDVRLLLYGNINYNEVLRLAEEQSVVGLVTAGLEHIADVKAPQEDVLQFIGSSLQIELQNKAMNVFVANLIEKLRKEDVYTLLVKGQGIAQCYERPLWRSSGDEDLVLSTINYQKAKNILAAIASFVDEESVYNLHLAMNIDSWPVELHGSLRSGLWKRIDNALDDVQKDVLNRGKVRSWMNNKTQVFLMHPDEDVVYTFSHILQHFFMEGIGIRQICDWCRLIWTYRESLNIDLLDTRIRKMGVMTEWKAFAALAVDNLGMPSEAMPMYSLSSKWSKKASKIMCFVLETGNFGHNRDYSYQKKYPYLLMKVISLWRHMIDFSRYFLIFPFDSIRVTWRKIKVGIVFVANGK